MTRSDTHKKSSCNHVKISVLYSIFQVRLFLQFNVHVGPNGFWVEYDPEMLKTFFFYLQATLKQPSAPSCEDEKCETKISRATLGTEIFMVKHQRSSLSHCTGEYNGALVGILQVSVSGTVRHQLTFDTFKLLSNLLVTNSYIINTARQNVSHGRLCNVPLHLLDFQMEITQLLVRQMS